MSLPLAFRFGCLSKIDAEFSELALLGVVVVAGESLDSWGENIRASPQGAVLMYKWNLILSCENYARNRFHMSDRISLFWTLKKLMPPRLKTQGNIPKTLSFFFEKTQGFANST